MSKKDNQAKFLLAYKKHYGNISEACKSIRIDRTTYYKWLESDKAFKEKIENLSPEEDFLDFLESSASKRIKEGSDSVLIFALKTKARKRGWNEKQELEVSNKDANGLDYDKLSDSEIQTLLRISRKARG